MNLGDIKHALLYCAAINYALLIMWFSLFCYAHDFLFRMHTRWFSLSRETFDALNYGGITLYKILVLVFNIVPWLALSLLPG